ncbi:MAG: hypothetical protein AAFX41_07130, partial [Bacteroidota bacterium]
GHNAGSRAGIVWAPIRCTVLDNVMAANPGPLPDEAVRRLYERVIDETRSLERRLSERPAAPVSGGSNQDEHRASDRSPDNSGT